MKRKLLDYVDRGGFAGVFACHSPETPDRHLGRGKARRETGLVMDARESSTLRKMTASAAFVTREAFAWHGVCVMTHEGGAKI